jgi:uncharacterized peroxidase-related enzyme
MQKPYIQLDQDFPGIVSLFMFDHEVASRLTAMGQTIMRRPRGLSVGERELIGAFVSKLNDCHFCCDSHAACAKEYLGDVVDKFIRNSDSEVLTPKMSALLSVAVYVQELDRRMIPHYIQVAKDKGATDEEIHDTVLITAFFCMCNRYVDGLGTTFKSGEPEQGGIGLAKYGYTMGVRRFFREVLPKMWAKFWG